MSDRRPSLRNDSLLVVGGWFAVLLFGLFSLGMAFVIQSGIREHEVPVVTVFTSGCFVAFAASCLLLLHSYRWSIGTVAGGLWAAVGCYFLEADMRAEGTEGFSLILVALPTFVAFLVAGGYARAARRRATKRVPEARANSS